jgi:hypothetical protein
VDQKLNLVWRTKLGCPSRLMQAPHFKGSPPQIGVPRKKTNQTIYVFLRPKKPICNFWRPDPQIFGVAAFPSFIATCGIAHVNITK